MLRCILHKQHCERKEPFLSSRRERKIFNGEDDGSTGSVGKVSRASEGDFASSRFNILRWGDEAVFGAVNLERRSVVGQPCRRLKRAAPKRALTPDKLAAVGTILFGAASPATILRSNKSVSIQAISERTYNKCQTGSTCESRCLESGVSTDPEPCRFARPRLAVRGFPVSGEKGTLVVEPSPGNRPKFVAIPYNHNTAHRLKAAARRFDTEVGFTCPFKLGTTCRLTNNAPEDRVLQEACCALCPLRHRSGVFGAPFLWGRIHRADSVNDRIREHQREIAKDEADSQHPMLVHLGACAHQCSPTFPTTRVLGAHKNRYGREILEAFAMKRAQHLVAATPPLEERDDLSEAGVGDLDGPDWRALTRRLFGTRCLSTPNVPQPPLLPFPPPFFSPLPSLSLV
ncbi:uncharacterized protein ISCGN_020744 [Ixodes scapularis]